MLASKFPRWNRGTVTGVYRITHILSVPLRRCLLYERSILVLLYFVNLTMQHLSHACVSDMSRINPELKYKP